MTRRLALLLVALLPSLATAGSLDGVRREVLDNGLVVLLLPEPGASIASVGMMYRVGARNEAAGITGLAHYCEHMNYRATRRFPGHEITESVTRRGGRWSGYTWLDQTWYRETMGPGDLEHMLDLERDRMAEALYDPEDFAHERTTVLAELHSYDDPEDALSDAVMAASFLAHPYRNNTIGWPSDVEGVTRDEAFAFYRRYYHPNNAVLALAGDFEPEAAMALVRARFGSLPANGATTEVRTVEPPQTGPRRVVLRQPGAESRLLLAFRAPALLDPDFPAFVLLDALLAGGKGLNFEGAYPAPPRTPLQDALAGRATGAKTHWQASRYPYAYTVAAEATDPQALAPAEESVLRLFAGAADREWTADERRRAVVEVARGVARDLDAQDARIHQLAFLEVAGGHRELLELPARLERVTVDELRRVARERLRSDLATVGWFVATPPETAAASTAPAKPAEASGSTTTRTTPSMPAAPRATSLAARPSPRTIDLGRGATLTIAPIPGAALAALRGRLSSGGAREGLVALAVEDLATPREGEDETLPALTWTLLDEPEAVVNRRAIEFTATGLPADAAALLRLAEGRLHAPAPEGAAFDRLREGARRRARERAETLETALQARVLQLFGAAPPWGSASAVAAVARDELVSFLGAGLGPPQLVAAGAVSADLATSAAGLADRSWAKRTAAAPSAARGAKVWTEVGVPWAASQCEIRVAWPADLSRAHDPAATAALLYLLGETHYAGRIGRALVEPGLVYSVDATLEGDHLLVRTAAAAADTREVLSRIRAILESAARGGFTAAELDEARSYARGKRTRSLDGAVTTAATLAEPAPPDLEALTLDQLNDTVRRLFRGGAPTAFVGGPAH